MARRRKDIEKRKRLAGESDAEIESPSVTGTPVGTFELEDRLSEEIPAARHTPPSEKRQKPSVGQTPGAGFLSKNKETLLLALLVLYVLLLGLGTVGELFEVGWILNLPLFK